MASRSFFGSIETFGASPVASCCATKRSKLSCPSSAATVRIFCRMFTSETVTEVGGVKRRLSNEIYLDPRRLLHCRGRSRHQMFVADQQLASGIYKLSFQFSCKKNPLRQDECKQVHTRRNDRQEREFVALRKKLPHLQCVTVCMVS